MSMDTNDKHKAYARGEIEFDELREWHVCGNEDTGDVRLVQLPFAEAPEDTIASFATDDGACDFIDRVQRRAQATRKGRNTWEYRDVEITLYPTGWYSAFTSETGYLKADTLEDVMYSIDEYKESQPMQYLIITTDDAPEVVEAEQDSYAQLKRIVNGTLAGITLSDGSVMYIDDDGKTKGLPTNPVATVMAREVLAGDDFVVGTVVVAGPVDEEGGDTSVRPSTIEWAMHEHELHESLKAIQFTESTLLFSACEQFEDFEGKPELVTVERHGGDLPGGYRITIEGLGAGPICHTLSYRLDENTDIMTLADMFRGDRTVPEHPLVTMGAMIQGIELKCAGSVDIDDDHVIHMHFNTRDGVTECQSMIMPKAEADPIGGMTLTAEEARWVADQLVESRG